MILVLVLLDIEMHDMEQFSYSENGATQIVTMLINTLIAVTISGK